MYQDNFLLENRFNVTDLCEDLVKLQQVKKCAQTMTAIGKIFL